MTSINSNKSLRSMQAELRSVEKNHGNTANVSEFKNPGLQALARTIATGCSNSVDLKQLRESLKTIGAEVRTADRNRDGKLTDAEQRKLSPLAMRLLQAAGKDVTRPAVDTDTGRVSTGCGTSTPSRPVSTGCSTTTPSRPTPPPAPRPTVTTGCGSSPTPRRPVGTGC